MDGRTARGQSASYGFFETAVWVTAGKTAVLPCTIWLPKIDTAHAVTIASPTTTETVVRTPLIPGLELRIPAGAVITDEDGEIVREVSITPIPVDQPPSGRRRRADLLHDSAGRCVRLRVRVGELPARRAADLSELPRPAGRQMEFWRYEPEDGRRWYVYGHGTVSADGRQIVPNVRRVTYDPAAGYLLTDTAAYGTSLARTTTLTRNSSNLVTRVTDGLGRHTDYSYDTAGNVTSVTRLAGTGNAVTTSYTYDSTFNLLPSVTDPLYKSRISWNTNGTWTLDLKDGTRMVFEDGFYATRPAQAGLLRIEDRYGNAIIAEPELDRAGLRHHSPCDPGEGDCLPAVVLAGPAPTAISSHALRITARSRSTLHVRHWPERTVIGGDVTALLLQDCTGSGPAEAGRDDGAVLAG